MLQDDLRYMMDNVNLPDDSVMKPLSIALCVRLKNALSQVSFSKETSSKVEIIKLPFEFDIQALTDAGPDPIGHDPVSHIMVVITNECIERFKSNKPFTINFCGIYRTNKYGKFNVIFKIVKDSQISEEIENKNWSEWLDWLQTDIHETIYDNVPGSYWGDIDIELKLKDGSIMKAYMMPYEEYTEDDYWKTYDLTDEHYNWPIKTDNVVEWRYLNEWENER